MKSIAFCLVSTPITMELLTTICSSQASEDHSIQVELLLLKSISTSLIQHIARELLLLTLELHSNHKLIQELFPVKLQKMKLSSNSSPTSVTKTTTDKSPCKNGLITILPFLPASKMMITIKCSCNKPGNEQWSDFKSEINERIQYLYQKHCHLISSSYQIDCCGPSSLIKIFNEKRQR